ncbi:MAG: hypothetical protein F7B61_05520 [Caldisphaeraceae archaeon]|nr:hypothetical protein [Caldisphaeraceae archaeon]
MMSKNYLLAFSLIMLIAVGMILPTISFSKANKNVYLSAPKMNSFKGTQNYTKESYIIVYPNSISLLLNGTAKARGHMLHSKYLFNFKESFLNSSKIINLNVVRKANPNITLKEVKTSCYHYSNGGYGVLKLSYKVLSSNFNATSHDNVTVKANAVNKLYYINISIQGSWNVSKSSHNFTFESMFSNYSEYSNLVYSKSFVLLKLLAHRSLNLNSIMKTLNISGLNVTYYKLSVGNNSLSLSLHMTFNATTSSQSNATMLINMLINNFLQPGYRLSEFSFYQHGGVAETNLYINETYSNTFKAPFNFNTHRLQRFATLKGINVSRIEKAVNASKQINSFISDHYVVAVPSSLSINVSSNGETVSYQVKTPRIAYKGATSPKENLVSLDYLIGNVSSILQQNGFIKASSQIRSLYNLSVTLVGKGVSIKPTHTTIGNLPNVTVTLLGSKNTKVAEIGGTTAGVIIIGIIVALLARKHI